MSKSLHRHRKENRAVLRDLATDCINGCEKSVYKSVFFPNFFGAFFFSMSERKSKCEMAHPDVLLTTACHHFPRAVLFT